MPTFVRLLVVEGVAFAGASLVHSGAFIDVSVDPGARTAEGVIAVVLFTGAIVIWLRPAWTRPVAVLAQGFGLLGSLVGLFLVTRGVAPGTVPDLAFHLAVVATLAVGVVAALRAEQGQARRSEAVPS